MTKSNEVSNVNSRIESISAGFTSVFSSLTDSWKGNSKDNIINKAQTALNELFNKITSQLKSLESAVKMATKYKELKKEYERLEQQYNSIKNDEESAEEAAEIYQKMMKIKKEMDELKKSIQSLLDRISGEESSSSKSNSSSNSSTSSKEKTQKNEELKANKNTDTKNSNKDNSKYSVDEYGIIQKNDGLPRSGSAAEKQAYLYPNGRPKSDSEARKHIVSTEVEYLDENGNRQKAKIQVHEALEEDVKEIFSEIADIGFKMKPSNYGNGAYIESYVYKDGGKSEHCLGAAVDINVADNPYTTISRDSAAGQSYNPSNNEYAVTEEVANIFRSHGWSWGGADWNSNKNGSRYDYMHFDFTEIGPQSQK